jgi:integrase
MARRPRSSTLENRSNRLGLPVRKKPHAFTTIAPGVGLAYRRNQGAGTWVVRVADGRGGNWTKGFAIADDHEDADDEHVLTFWQAQDKARNLARGKEHSSERPATLGEAIGDYEKDLIARDGNISNAKRVRYHLTPTLLAKPVGLLTTLELRRWRNGLIASGMKRSTVLRTIKALRAACNLAAAHDKRITNRDAWGKHLTDDLADTFNARNTILSDQQVLAIVAAAYAVDPAFGMYAELLACVGTRPSQAAKLEVADLQADRPDPRLMMPTSRKGRRRRQERKPVPITPDLAAKLRQAAGDRAPTAPLLVRSNGQPWQPERSDHSRLFAQAAERAGVECTLYALRHSSIVRSLLAGTPTRVTAAMHDTSVIMLERTYSQYILDHSDAVARRGLLDLAQPAVGNVVALPGRRS